MSTLAAVEAFAFKSLKSESLAQALALDQARAEHFIDLTGRARNQAGRQSTR